MNAGIYTCPPETILRNALQEMAKRNISSVVIVDENQFPIGIVTERDVLRRIAAKSEVDIDSTRISVVMTKNPIALTPEDTVYRALSVLKAHRIKHLIIVENGKASGMVTLWWLLKMKYPEPTELIEDIRLAEGAEDLKRVRNKVPEVAALKIGMGLRAYDIIVMISMINQDIHRKAMELASARNGMPPVPFCLYVTGSHGRLENLLSTDQDHGLIIADNDHNLQYSDYYVDLADEFSAMLNEIGFKTCPGYIMCLNPLWRKSLSEWKQQLSYWFQRQVPQLGRFVTVLFDAAPIYGDRQLFTDMNNHAFSLFGKHHDVARILYAEEAKHRSPIGLFGRFITEKSGPNKGELELKRSGLMFLIEGLRILALKHSIREVTTLKRTSALVKNGIIHADDGEYFESAYHILLHFALEAQLEKIKQGQEVNTFIKPSYLSQLDRETLRHAFKAVGSLQSLIGAEFGNIPI